MDTAHETRPPGGPPPPGSRPPLGGLTRATDDTVISGLCGGLGRQFGIDPLVFRIAFVVMSLAGGTGILLYLIGWALVPDDQGKTFGAQWLPGKDRSHKLLAAGLAGVGVLLLLDRITDGHGDDIPLGLVLIGLGAAVLWSRRGGQTIPPTPPPASTVSAAPTAQAHVVGEADATTDSTTDLTTPPPAGSSAWADTVSTAPLPPPPVGSSAWADTVSTAPLPPPPPAPPVYSRRAPAPPKPPKPPKPRSALVSVTLSLLAILAGVVALAGADLVVGLALALFLVSGAMVVGAWRGRARGLIPVAIVLAGALFVASLLDVPFKGGAGERLYTPASVAEIHSPYRLVAGELRLDLRRVDLAGRTVPVVVSMATGNIIVTVPAGAAVEVDAHVGAGDMVVFGRDWAGVGVDERIVVAGQEGAGRLLLDARVGLGQLEVRRAAA